MDKFYHSVRLDESLCKGCINCIKRCPTEAIRVRGGKASINNKFCIDCGECRAGPEIAVASTKAYTTQLVTLLLLSLYMGRLNGNLPVDREEKILADLTKLPDQCQAIFDQVDFIKGLCSAFKDKEDVFFSPRRQRLAQNR